MWTINDKFSPSRSSLKLTDRAWEKEEDRKTRKLSPVTNLLSQKSVKEKVNVMPSCKDDAIFPLSQFKIQDIVPEGKREGFSHSAEMIQWFNIIQFVKLFRWKREIMEV